METKTLKANSYKNLISLIGKFSIYISINLSTIVLNDTVVIVIIFESIPTIFLLIILLSYNRYSC